MIGWIDGSEQAELLLYQLDRLGGSVEVTFCIRVKEDFSWTVHYHGRLINKEQCAKIKEIPCYSNSGMIILTYTFHAFS